MIETVGEIWGVVSFCCFFCQIRCVLAQINGQAAGNPVLFPEKYMKLTGKLLIFLAIIIIV